MTAAGRTDETRTRAPRDATETRLERTRHDCVPVAYYNVIVLLLLILFGCQKAIKKKINK